MQDEAGYYAIEVEGLVKKFGGFKALSGLNLQVRIGEVHGFLGPNGAGKSTTIRVLLGLLRKNEGTARVLGGDPWRDSVQLHRRLAYVPGDVDLWPNLSGGEAIDLLGRLRGGIDKKRRDKLVDTFKLDPRKKCGAYSKGNRQKVAIIAALASEVELYIFDEPTSGLDPLMQSLFQSQVEDLKRAGKTVLLSSHILAEVEALCDKVTIIKEGSVVESGALSDLRQLRLTTISVETENQVTGLEKISGVQDIKIDNGRLTFRVAANNIDTALSHLVKFQIRSLISAPPTLEELFMRHYNTSKEEG
jgi:ABC-2 type transport system ATP-binding protein